MPETTMMMISTFEAALSGQLSQGSSTQPHSLLGRSCSASCRVPSCTSAAAHPCPSQVARPVGVEPSVPSAWSPPTGSWAAAPWPSASPPSGACPAAPAPQDAVSDEQLSTLQARMESLHVAKLLSDDEFFAIEDLCVDFAELTVGARGSQMRRGQHAETHGRQGSRR